MDMSAELEHFIDGVKRGYAVEIHGVGRYETLWGEIEYVHPSMGMVDNNGGEWAWQEWERDFWELGADVNAHFHRQKEYGPMESISPF